MSGIIILFEVLFTFTSTSLLIGIISALTSK